MVVQVYTIPRQPLLKARRLLLQQRGVGPGTHQKFRERDDGVSNQPPVRRERGTSPILAYSVVFLVRRIRLEIWIVGIRLVVVVNQEKVVHHPHHDVARGREELVGRNPRVLFQTVPIDRPEFPGVCRIEAFVERVGREDHVPGFVPGFRGST